MKRSERRSFLQRQKLRVKFRFKNINFGGKDLAEDVKFIGKNSVNRKMCSCFICGNFRKNCGITQQEIISNISLKEYIKDLI